MVLWFPAGWRQWLGQGFYGKDSFENLDFESCLLLIHKRSQCRLEHNKGWRKQTGHISPCVMGTLAQKFKIKMRHPCTIFLHVIGIIYSAGWLSGHRAPKGAVTTQPPHTTCFLNTPLRRRKPSLSCFSNKTGTNLKSPLEYLIN